MAAFASGTRNVSRRHVEQAAADARYSLPPVKRFGAPLMLGLGVACGIAGLAMIAVHFLQPTAPQPLTAPVATAYVAAVAAPPVAMSAPLAVAPSSPVATPTPPATPESQRIQVSGLGPIAAGLLEVSRAHIAQAPSAGFFVQIQRVSAADAPSLEGFLERTRQAIDPAQLRLYQAKIDGRIRYGVIFGDYASAKEAAIAIAKMPEWIRALGVYPRQYSALH